MQTPNDSRQLPCGILIEAEDFDGYGGRVLDSQFEQQMGSPYLLAHGMGRQVADAKTMVKIPNAAALAMEFGASGEDWSWAYAEPIALTKGKVSLALQDLTGFDGRFDSIFLGLGSVRSRMIHRIAA